MNNVKVDSYVDMNYICAVICNINELSEKLHLSKKEVIKIFYDELGTRIVLYNNCCAINGNHSNHTLQTIVDNYFKKMKN